MGAYTKHPDYDDDELHHATTQMYYVAFRDDKPEALITINSAVRFLFKGTSPELMFYRIPEWVYDLQVAFETLPVYTIDNYLW